MSTKGTRKTAALSKPQTVFLYVPNLIGYVRLVALVLSWISHALSRPDVSLVLYGISAILDFFDGFFARRLGQTSVFGAWFDVFIDVLGRTTLWAIIFSPGRFPWGQLVGALEWVAFLSLHADHGSRWKTRMLEEGRTLEKSENDETMRVMSSDESSKGTSDSNRNDGLVREEVPRWVSRCFVNGFKCTWGAWVISGVHALPPWLYALRHGVASLGVLGTWMGWCHTVVTPVLVAGRLYAAAVEVWIIYDHLRFLGRQKLE